MKNGQKKDNQIEENLEKGDTFKKDNKKKTKEKQKFKKEKKKSECPRNRQEQTQKRKNGQRQRERKNMHKTYKFVKMSKKEKRYLKHAEVFQE